MTVDTGSMRDSDIMKITDPVLLEQMMASVQAELAELEHTREPNEGGQESNQQPEVSAMSLLHNPSAKAMSLLDNPSAKAMSLLDNPSAKAMSLLDNPSAKVISLPDTPPAKAISLTDNPSAKAMSLPENLSAKALDGLGVTQAARERALQLESFSFGPNAYTSIPSPPQATQPTSPFKPQPEPLPLPQTLAASVHQAVHQPIPQAVHRASDTSGTPHQHSSFLVPMPARPPLPEVLEHPQFGTSPGQRTESKQAVFQVAVAAIPPVVTVAMGTGTRPPLASVPTGTDELLSTPMDSVHQAVPVRKQDASTSTDPASTSIGPSTSKHQQRTQQAPAQDASTSTDPASTSIEPSTSKHQHRTQQAPAQNASTSTDPVVLGTEQDLGPLNHWGAGKLLHGQLGYPQLQGRTQAQLQGQLHAQAGTQAPLSFSDAAPQLEPPVPSHIPSRSQSITGLAPMARSANSPPRLSRPQVSSGSPLLAAPPGSPPWQPPPGSPPWQAPSGSPLLAAPPGSSPWQALPGSPPWQAPPGSSLLPGPTPTTPATSQPPSQGAGASPRVVTPLSLEGILTNMTCSPHPHARYSRPKSSQESLASYTSSPLQPTSRETALDPHARYSRPKSSQESLASYTSSPLQPTSRETALDPHARYSRPKSSQESLASYTSSPLQPTSREVASEAPPHSPRGFGGNHLPQYSPSGQTASSHGALNAPPAWSLEQVSTTVVPLGGEGLSPRTPRKWNVLPEELFGAAVLAATCSSLKAFEETDDMSLRANGHYDDFQFNGHYDDSQSCGSSEKVEAWRPGQQSPEGQRSAGSGSTRSFFSAQPSPVDHAHLIEVQQRARKLLSEIREPSPVPELVPKQSSVPTAVLNLSSLTYTKEVGAQPEEDAGNELNLQAPVGLPEPSAPSSQGPAASVPGARRACSDAGLCWFWWPGPRIRLGKGRGTPFTSLAGHPGRFWQPFNKWYRSKMVGNLRTPTSAVRAWFDKNATMVWSDPGCRPGWQETLIHANGLRSAEEVKKYNRNYKSKKGLIKSATLAKKAFYPVPPSTSNASAHSLVTGGSYGFNERPSLVSLATQHNELLLARGSNTPLDRSFGAEDQAWRSDSQPQLPTSVVTSLHKRIAALPPFIVPTVTSGNVYSPSRYSTNACGESSAFHASHILPLHANPSDLRQFPPGSGVSQANPLPPSLPSASSSQMLLTPHVHRSSHPLWSYPWDEPTPELQQLSSSMKRSADECYSLDSAIQASKRSCPEASVFQHRASGPAPAPNPFLAASHSASCVITSGSFEHSPNPCAFFMLLEEP
eukprot:gene8033-1265_t